MLAYPNVLLLGGALTDNCEESPAARHLIIIQRNHIFDLELSLQPIGDGDARRSA
jgi:hypothetical protein